MKVNYYIVSIPKDATSSQRYAAFLAITEAEERSRKFKLPCTWFATLVGETSMNYIFRVTRYAN